MVMNVSWANLFSRLQVSCKVIAVNSGPDIMKHISALIQHFKNEGTPVMIGGGVLAYTLLGIDYNNDSSDIRFLILDPHYTGVDELKPIRDKWCGWKPLTLFRADAHYNFCLPLKAKEI